MVRGRDDLVQQRVALANQLRSLLESFWPGAAALFAAIDSPIALAFVTRHPTPDSASRPGGKRLASFMAQNSYCGRRSAAGLLARLRAAPTGLASGADAIAPWRSVCEAVGGEATEGGEIARVLADVIEQLVAAIAKLASRIEHAMVNLPDGQIVMSFPRTGRICEAGVLAELGNVRERSPTEDQLAAGAGACLVTHASGKSRGVAFRWACNKNLRAAITCFADNSRHAYAWAAAIYTRAKQRGCKHPHAVRVLARAWICVLWRAWQNHTL